MFSIWFTLDQITQLIFCPIAFWPIGSCHCSIVSLLHIKTRDLTILLPLREGKLTFRKTLTIKLSPELTALHTLRCFDAVFRRPYRYFSIALKGILSVSDRYKIFASDWLWIEVCQNVVLTKINITVATINKKNGNW